VDNNSERQFAVCAFEEAIIVCEELGCQDKYRDHQLSERVKAVNETLPKLYEMLLVCVESEFETAGQAVADLEVELSLNRILKPTTTPCGNLTFFTDNRRVLDLHGGPFRQPYSVAIA
jgi:hypothetical protein